MGMPQLLQFLPGADTDEVLAVINISDGSAAVSGDHDMEQMTDATFQFLCAAIADRGSAPVQMLVDGTHRDLTGVDFLAESADAAAIAEDDRMLTAAPADAVVFCGHIISHQDDGSAGSDAVAAVTGDGGVGGRLSYVSLSGGFGTITVGQIWSASYNHYGAKLDPTWFNGLAGGATGRTGNTVSYSSSAGDVSFQIDKVTGDDDMLQFGATRGSRADGSRARLLECHRHRSILYWSCAFNRSRWSWPGHRIG